MPAADAFDAIILSGSRYNLSAPETIEIPFVKATAELIRAAAASGRPRIVGFCFGAQLIAAALGGTVTRNPGEVFLLKAEDIVPTADFAALSAAAGIVLGPGSVAVHEADRTEAPDCDCAAATGASASPSESSATSPASGASASGTSPCLRIIVSHGDCVATLPPGSRHLGSSASCRNEVRDVLHAVLR